MSDLDLEILNDLKPVDSLSNYDLEKLCAGKLFHGVFNRDSKFPEFKKGVIIINLDASEGLGTHWVLAFKNGKECFYFDSFGFFACKEIEDYFRKSCSDYSYSGFRLQDGGSFCGHLCVMVLECLRKGFTFEESVLKLVK